MKGKVIKWKEAGGYGFIARDRARDLYVHANNIEGPLKELVPGDAVSFEIGDGRQGPQAINVRVIKK